MAVIIEDVLELPTQIPPEPIAGDSYFDMNLLVWRFWNGAQWVIAG